MTTPSQICDTGCGLNATLRIISGKWKPLILFFLRDGPKRYGELKRLTRGVSDKVLIQQLKDLEADRVVARTDYKEVPPRVDYALTPLGRSPPTRSSRCALGEPRTQRKWQASSPSATRCPSGMLKNRRVGRCEAKGLRLHVGRSVQISPSIQ